MYLIALDQGTTSCRALLYDAAFRRLDISQREFPQHFPAPGWVEHDAGEIWRCQAETLRELLARNPGAVGKVAALGITNQRETVVAWDRRDGKPLSRAIVWQDRRTADDCARLRREGLEPWVRRRTGLVLDPYFSATKMRWLLRRVPAVRAAARAGRLAFGTMDSWLIRQLTGRHLTEPGNASRTQLLRLDRCAWDPDLLKLFGIPADSLPDILDSDGDFGAADFPGLEGVPVRGVAGDQQASLFGQGCHAPGEAKNTYGTGCFLLRNIGRKASPAPKGLLATVAWRLRGKTTYAHEGAVLVAGAAIQFLRDNLGLIAAAADSEALARSLPTNEGVYFVPAFAGLGTPHWDAEARGLVVGLTRGTGRAHLCRAALEAIAYQVRELCDAFGPLPKVLRVDGGASRNRFLMQFQADILGRELRVRADAEATALGAAMLAGLGAGLAASPAALRALPAEEERYRPAMGPAERRRSLDAWRAAVARSKGWAALARA